MRLLHHNQDVKKGTQWVCAMRRYRQSLTTTIHIHHPDENLFYQLDTLGQNRTEHLKEIAVNPIILHGSGTDLSTGNTVNLVKKKQINQSIALNLITVAEKKGKPEKDIKHYWNTYHCLSEVTTSESRLYGNNYKTRICTICTAIHKAELINTYLPIIKTWPEAHFVTLTVSAIPANKLNVYMQDLMLRGIRKIIEKYRKPYERGKGKKIMGIRSLECNFNPIKRTYNPHFHIIVPDQETGEILIKEWLKLWHKVKPCRQAQHIRKVKDSEHDMIETIKYGTKIFTDPTMKKDKKKKNLNDYKVYLSAYENIIHSFHNTRRHEHFGFKLNKRVSKPKPVENNRDLKTWVFDPKNSNWSDNSNKGELLVNGPIDFASIETVKSIIDDTAE